MSLIILDEAKVEINELVAWYRDRNQAIAERLAALFVDVVAEIAAHPHRYSLMEMRRNPGNIRRALLKNFPIYVAYQILGDDIYVLAVAHTSRRPAYWRSRLKKA